MAKIPNVNIDKIKKLAKEQGRTMTYFCDHFGKKPSYLADIRAGKNDIEESELNFITETLNTTIEYLTDKTEKKEKPVTIEDDRLWENILNNETKLRLAEKLVQMSEEQLLQVEQILDFVLSKDISPHPTGLE